MKHLDALLADFIFELAREKTDDLTNVLKTYSNKNLSDKEKIMLWVATTAFLVQTSCKRLTTNEKDEEQLIKETLAGLRESIESNGGKIETIDMVEDIISEVKLKLAKQKENNLPIVYASTLVIMGIDASMADNYIKELITSVEYLYESVEKIRHELKS
ncbi:MAG: hypothetical protein COU25_02135 [Candidatus Levybacteria bacterium CG10_big_fil_rev_8_21_14_0_10_35_13]|nr:MAG: hypothetical protein COU25_02135 [Candidatus Levybacteria bacterium CG10_big_fil_rev_8_21_14_0_10_35_13]